MRFIGLKEDQRTAVENGRIIIQKILKSTKANLGLDEDTITIRTIFKIFALRRLVDEHIYQQVTGYIDPKSSIFGLDCP